MSGGSAWSQDHDKILDHARGLQYDHVPGVSLPDADASRDTWTTAMDAFNDWKAREVAKEAEGQAWWQTYKGGEGGGGTPKGGGKPTPDWDNPDPGTGTGPYPDSNIYFPMLVPEYNDPKAQDWSQYMSQGGSGLLFQPWSEEYGEQYMQPSIWDYQPPELKVGRPKYYQNPLGIMDVTDYVPPSESKEPTEREKIESGNYDGNPGYDGYDTDRDGMSPDVKAFIDNYNEENPMKTLTPEQVKTLFTQYLRPTIFNTLDTSDNDNDMEGWGGGGSGQGSGGSSGVGPGGVGGGVGKGY
jgi:hypothetical protein|tara:strand:+ start:1220 stop:2113 length:894 start_codon:yes stop_codon:yes gene_type:complete